MTKDELSHIMARTIKGAFVDFTECANEVFKEVEKIQSENAELKELIERLNNGLRIVIDDDWNAFYEELYEKYPEYKTQDNE